MKREDFEYEEREEIFEQKTKEEVAEEVESIKSYITSKFESLP